MHSDTLFHSFHEHSVPYLHYLYKESFLFRQGLLGHTEEVIQLAKIWEIYQLHEAKKPLKNK